MSALSFGCQSCATLDSFNGSLQGLQPTFGGNNNGMINQMIEDNNFSNNNSNMVGNDMVVNNNANSEISYNADLRQNNYGSNNYNQPNNQMNQQMNNQQMNNSNQTYGNGNNMNQHPMNNNYNDVKLPQVVGTPKPTPKHRPIPNNNIVQSPPPVKDTENKFILYIKIGILVLCALAVHETIKYYINHSIKFNEGSPTYFVYYSIGCVVAFYFVNNYVKFE